MAPFTDQFPKSPASLRATVFLLRVDGCTAALLQTAFSLLAREWASTDLPKRWGWSTRNFNLMAQSFKRLRVSHRQVLKVDSTSMEWEWVTLLSVSTSLTTSKTGFRWGLQAKNTPMASFSESSIKTTTHTARASQSPLMAASKSDTSTMVKLPLATTSTSSVVVSLWVRGT